MGHPRVHRPAEHRLGDSDGPPDQRVRSCRPHSVSGVRGVAGGVSAAPRGGAHRSPLTAPPRPWHPTHSSLLRGARRHGTFSACLGPPRLHARHRDQGGGLGGPDEARAARLGAACRPSLAGAAHHAQAYAEEPVAPVAHELVARIDRAVQLSHALPTIKFETTNIRPQKRPARAARAGERLASQPASLFMYNAQPRSRTRSSRPARAAPRRTDLRRVRLLRLGSVCSRADARADGER